MSDQTTRILDEATTVVTAKRAEAEVKKRECLGVVADGIPAAVDRLAKGVAQSQPDVTKELGAAGIKALREELAAEASELATLVRNGFEGIEWPNRDSEWSKVEPRNVHTALFGLMYGPPVDKVGNVFGRHGYDVRRVRGSQGLVLPQQLYDENSFIAVAEALNDLGIAEIAYRKAKSEDDRDVVDSLWEEG